LTENATPDARAALGRRALFFGFVKYIDGLTEVNRKSAARPFRKSGGDFAK
jgi:hypothetical protein